jgi:hypothetical protein
MMYTSIIVIASFVGTLALMPKSSRFASKALSGKSSFELGAIASDKPVLNSKLLADVTPAELQDLFKEFNVTNFDFVNKDAELAQWGPSKEFFEMYGFQNNTERYARKTMHVKMDFYSAYKKPILPQYKTFVADVMSMTHVQSIDSRYRYDALHAFGICTQYYTIMKGYALQDEIDVIFNEMMKAVGLDPVRIRDDAKKVLGAVNALKEAGNSEEEILALKDGELGSIFETVRTNRFFKYTDAWGIGLGRIMELVGVEPKVENFERWCTSLRWVFAPRMSQSWEEFSADQMKMQGVEAMQKQLLIREKKRAAARLEKKASEFEDKKKALQELNEAIEERRQVMISEAKELKKKYEPDEYERLMQLSGGSAAAPAPAPVEPVVAPADVTVDAEV